MKVEQMSVKDNIKPQLNLENESDWATHWHPDCGYLHFDGEQYEDKYSTVLFDPKHLIKIKK